MISRYLVSKSGDVYFLLSLLLVSERVVVRQVQVVFIISRQETQESAVDLLPEISTIFNESTK